MTNNTGEGHLRSPGEKGQTIDLCIPRYTEGLWSNKKNRDLELRYLFLGKLFAKNVKMTLKHFFKHQSVKKQIRKNTVKSRYDVKSACFLKCFMLYLSHFWRYRLVILHTYSWDIAPNTCYGFFEKNLFEKLFRKKEIGHFFSTFSKCWKSEMAVFVALLILRHFI